MGIFDGTLILSDLDGTLLNSNAEVSRGNAEALEYYMQNGGRFSFASGRHISGVRYFMNDIPSNAPGVVSNGALIYDFAEDRPVEAFPLGMYGELVADEVMARFPDVGVEIMMPDLPYVLNHTEITASHIKYTKMPLRLAKKEEVPKPWLHMLLTRDPESIAELEFFLKARFGDNIFVQYSAPYFLEVLIAGANKGRAALRICELLNIQESGLYTVGDGTNDIELIKCTRNSFAPENAYPGIMKLAKHLLPDNDSDPIATLVAYIEGERK